MITITLLVVTVLLMGLRFHRGFLAVASDLVVAASCLAWRQPHLGFANALMVVA